MGRKERERKRKEGREGRRTREGRRAREGRKKPDARGDNASEIIPTFPKAERKRILPRTAIQTFPLYNPPPPPSLPFRGEKMNERTIGIRHCILKKKG